MPSKPSIALNASLRDLPSIDEMLRTSAARVIAAEAGERHAADLARRVVAALREELMTGASAEADLSDLCERRMGEVFRSETLSGTRSVINATGVVDPHELATRPLSESAKKAIVSEASGYCTLEYGLATGKRGKRGERAEQLLTELTGAESALIVNNCAAAAFFVLTVFASGSEVILSRGEMVEIGGDFRMPDVLSQSGAILCEVGTTNRTKLTDYDEAIRPDTKMILRVHPSNYRIVGFTAAPTLTELTILAHERGLLIYEDIGSGALIDLSGLGLVDEPVVKNSVQAGVDVVTFSGDKLLGGPQAGIIVGKRDVVERLRSHPLYRPLRVDKLIYAALEATLDSYRRVAAVSEVPVLRMMSASLEELSKRAKQLVGNLKNEALLCELVDGFSAIGGGAAPAIELPTKLIAMNYVKESSSSLEQKLRALDPPVIARIIDDRVMLDLRTVSEADEHRLIEALNGLN